MASRHDSPTVWAGAKPLGGDVYWRTDPDEPANTAASIIVWHWCSTHPPDGRWVAAMTGDHQLISMEPLHLEPSLMWPCCGKHGHIRGGQWVPA